MDRTTENQLLLATETVRNSFEQQGVSLTNEEAHMFALDLLHNQQQQQQQQRKEAQDEDAAAIIEDNYKIINHDKATNGAAANTANGNNEDHQEKVDEEDEFDPEKAQQHFVRGLADMFLPLDDNLLRSNNGVIVNNNDNDDENEKENAAAAVVPSSAKQMQQPAPPPQHPLSQTEDQQQSQLSQSQSQRPVVAPTPFTIADLRDGIAEQINLNANSFAAARYLPQLWRWAAFRKLRHDIAVESRKQTNGSGSPTTAATTTTKTAAPPPTLSDAEVLHCVTTPQLPRRPNVVAVLRIASNMDCQAFSTHMVVVADTEVKYRIVEKVPSGAVMLKPSLVRHHKKQAIEQGIPLNQDIGVEATIVWRTMHFARRDGTLQGSFEIQSTSLRFFEARTFFSHENHYQQQEQERDQQQPGGLLASGGLTPEDAARLTELGGAGNVHPKLQVLYDAVTEKQEQQQSAAATNGAVVVHPRHHQHDDPQLIFLARTAPQLWRGHLECYTRPTMQFIFVWLLYQNNADLRRVVTNKLKNQNVATAPGGTASKKNTKTAGARRGRAGNADNDDDEGEDDDQEVTVSDYLDDIKNKLWLNLFDHVPTFAVLGMGANVIGNYLGNLFPWCDVHVAELEPAVIVSNIMNHDFPSSPTVAERWDDEQKKEKEKAGNNNNNNNSIQPASDCVEGCGRQFGHLGDVFELLGCKLQEEENHQQQQQQQEAEQDKAANINDNSNKILFPSSELSVIFLDCFDPVAVNMDHSKRVIAACHSHLRVNGILAVNTHLAMTHSGRELRPFCEVFEGEESVQVVSIAGFQQALIVCQKRSPASIRRGPAHVPGSVREYRAIARIASTCPVFVKLCGGVLREVVTPNFFAPSVFAAEEAAIDRILHREERRKAVDNFVIGADDDDDDEGDDSSNLSSPDGATATKQQKQQQQRRHRLPTAAQYAARGLCKARVRIADPCECLLCTSKWLDASIFDLSNHVSVTVSGQDEETVSEQQQAQQHAHQKDERKKVSVRRWLTHS